jgi:hypothetical protein
MALSVTHELSANPSGQILVLWSVHPMSTGRAITHIFGDFASLPLDTGFLGAFHADFAMPFGEQDEGKEQLQPSNDFPSL